MKFNFASRFRILIRGLKLTQVIIITTYMCSRSVNLYVIFVIVLGINCIRNTSTVIHPLVAIDSKVDMTDKMMTLISLPVMQLSHYVSSATDSLFMWLYLFWPYWSNGLICFNIWIVWVVFISFHSY